MIVKYSKMMIVKYSKMMILWGRHAMLCCAVFSIFHEIQVIIKRLAPMFFPFPQTPEDMETIRQFISGQLRPLEVKVRDSPKKKTISI
jgi:hypothetical protein